MAKAVGVSDRSVRRILKEAGLKARKDIKGHMLTEDMKVKRLERCKKLQRRFAAGRHRRTLITGDWPSNSPELNVMDYSIWGILEAKACAKPHASIEALKRDLIKAWDEIPLETIAKAVDDFPKRLKKCIEANGGHFEQK
jgi:hypothetical protein